MSTKPVKTRDDYALGVANKQTGKRDGGFLKMLKKMANNRAKLVSGEISEDDLVVRAYEMADAQIAKNMAGPDEEPQTFSEEDAAYRAEQEDRYREAYDWSDATPNDEASLQMILDLEVQARVVNREFAVAHMNVKDRKDLLGELRNIAKDHAELQKRLGFDRPSRENKKSSDDPMQEWKRVVESAQQEQARLFSEWPEVAASVSTQEELLALAKHHLQRGYDLLVPLLDAHKRVLGTSVPSVSTSVEPAYEEQP